MRTCISSLSGWLPLCEDPACAAAGLPALLLPLSLPGTISDFSWLARLLLRRNQPITGLPAGWISPTSAPAPATAAGPLPCPADEVVSPWEDSAPDVPTPVLLELTVPVCERATCTGCNARVACCVLLMTPAAVCALAPVGTVPMLLLPDSVYAALDRGVTPVRSWNSPLLLAVDGPCSMCSGTSCCWYFQKRVNMRRAVDADDPAPSLLGRPGAGWDADEPLSVPAAMLLDNVLVPTDSGPPAPAAAAAMPGRAWRGTNSGMMLMTTLSLVDGPAGACCRPAAVLVLEAAWLAVPLLRKLAEPELRRPAACLRCGPLRGELASNALRCAAACSSER